MKYADVRKKYIEKEFMHLNSMQREAVMATEGPLLILAGAGSGKTTVLINRIYNLLKYGKATDSYSVPEWAGEEALAALESGPSEEADMLAALEPAAPWRILAITFTNKAAGELKARLENMLGDRALDIWACTFHAACLRILRRDCDRFGFTSNFTIYDTNDSVSLLKHIIRDMNLDDKHFAPKAVLNEISRSKDKMMWPEEYKQLAEAQKDLHKIKIGEIYGEYMHRLEVSDSMDFDDLILYTVTLLERYEDVRTYWQNRFRYVLIDEYQDTNMLQYRFSELISGGYKNICVVGDDDQSIYKFRGATIENILSFESRYTDCRTIRLEQNYRSTGNILDAANAVIRNNTERKGKELWTDKDAGDKIELYVAGNEHEEAQYVANGIVTGRSSGENWRDYAVLYRKNAQSNNIEYALKRNGIPYRIVGGTRFFDRAEIKDILSYMCVISAPNDNLRLERIINNPPRGIGAKSIEKASELAAEEGTSLFDVISHADMYPELARASLRMREFSSMIRELQEFSLNNTPDVLFDEIVRRTGYVSALLEKNTPEETARAENVQELKSSILSFMEESGDNTLSGYLANVALYTDLDNYDRDADCVTLMTMHSSKGLEFPHVYIVGMEETIFPSMQAIGMESEMEEERRLCYVAITRAMKTLNLVCASQRMIFGQTSANRVSRFVDEIPEENIHSTSIPRGYGYSDQAYPSYRVRSESGFGTGYSSSVSAGNKKPLSRNALGFSSGYGSEYSSGEGRGAKKGIVPPTQEKKAPAAVPSFSEGDRVKHKAFGVGSIVKLTPMGGDFLVEISFDEIGTKKLMLRAAAQFMEKI
ncbi:MAG: UvrD-helicase domain-containing protein [Eubacteriales bacterium]|nr:UvrD-helicase domain-containing protein [Eubacteriales bacterium]